MRSSQLFCKSSQAEISVSVGNFEKRVACGESVWGIGIPLFGMLLKTVEEVDGVGVCKNGEGWFFEENWEFRGVRGENVLEIGLEFSGFNRFGVGGAFCRFSVDILWFSFLFNIVESSLDKSCVIFSENDFNVSSSSDFVTNDDFAENGVRFACTERLLTIGRSERGFTFVSAESGVEFGSAEMEAEFGSAEMEGEHESEIEDGLFIKFTFGCKFFDFSGIEGVGWMEAFFWVSLLASARVLYGPLSTFAECCFLLQTTVTESPTWGFEVDFILHLGTEANLFDPFHLSK